MKKILATTIIVVLVAAMSIGVVMAEEEPPTTPDGKSQVRDRADNRVIADYMNQAIADLLGISLEEYDAYKQTGATLSDIAEDLGIDAETMATLHNDAREKAYEAAMADGMITDREYQYFQLRTGKGQGGWQQGGRGNSNNNGKRNGNGGGQGGGGQFGDGLCDGTGECDGTGILEPIN